MVKLKLHLVTTGDERTWQPHEPVLFLGDWCLKHERKQIYSELDYIKMEPTSINFNDKTRKEARNLEKIIFPTLVTILNHHHQTTYSEKFWKILAGHWFRYFSFVITYQKNIIDLAIEKYDIASTTLIKISDEELIPKDLSHMLNLLQLETYKSAIDYEVLSHFNELDLSINQIHTKLDQNETNKPEIKNFSIRTVLKIARKLMQWFSYSTAKYSNVYINSTYLPRWTEIRLKLSFLQLPFMWQNYFYHEISSKSNIQLRERLKYQIIDKNDENIINKLLFKFLPICYLEGFDELMAKVKSLNFPRNPDFLFVSNDFESFEVFKLYSALCSEKGIPYLIGQHGNNYGVNKIVSPTIEEEVATKFITWGWSSTDSRYVPGFIFKIKPKSVNLVNSGGLLLVQSPFKFFLPKFNEDQDFDSYFDDQVKFIDSLQPRILNEVMIKLNTATASSISEDVARLKEINSQIKIYTYEMSYEEIRSKSRITVFAYDSTGILENLTQNIPTIAFWQNGTHHVADFAQRDYQSLLEIGVLHLTPESAALKVSQVWDNVDSWWSSDVVQRVRLSFCSNYARTSRKPIRDLRKIIKDSVRD